MLNLESNECESVLMKLILNMRGCNKTCLSVCVFFFSCLLVVCDGGSVSFKMCICDYAGGCVWPLTLVWMHELKKAGKVFLCI